MAGLEWLLLKDFLGFTLLSFISPLSGKKSYPTSSQPTSAHATLYTFFKAFQL